ncbi:hypothetical protein COLO4_25880 [Corchorus olitorius]|uniref:Uncharacterized protein n=1 Tax=Corchorus olitorius TaxID=93759 RepID=A0A1R3HZQ1_9ROSI|nr:hypothetical protein COLO4_25880 [Corchorus olitorius]
MSTVTLMIVLAELYILMNSNSGILFKAKQQISSLISPSTFQLSIITKMEVTDLHSSLLRMARAFQGNILMVDAWD